MRIVSVSLVVLALSCQEDSASYRGIIEAKYAAPIERFEVISYSPTTKVLWFDWERNWWGSFNVIETNEKGHPLYWYDIPQHPTAQRIESIQVVMLSDKKYLEVIDCTHMGNGFLYLYEIRAGRLRLKLRVRVIANLSVHFDPRIAKVVYRDLDDDGDMDLTLDATCIKGQVVDASATQVGKYHREYLFREGCFHEQKDKRLGRKELMD